MASLSPHEIEEDGVETDRNSIFLVETDAQFQPLSEEIVINMGGDSDWGVRPAVSKLGDNYAVVFLSNNSPSASLRSEEHTSELQSRGHLVCRLLLEKKNTNFIVKQEIAWFNGRQNFNKIEFYHMT